jgi:IS5 family transposase
VLTDNRHGLVVNVQASAADGYAERDVAERMPSHVAKPDVRITVGADKGYDTRGFVKACRTMNVTPHVAQNWARSGARAQTAARRGLRSGSKRRSVCRERRISDSPLHADGAPPAPRLSMY